MGEKMKVLWIVNVVFPEVCDALGLPKTVIGGWLYSYRSAIKSLYLDLKLYIVSPYSGNDVRCIESKGDTFCVFPQSISKKDMQALYSEIHKDFNPDVVHIHGTEFYHSLSYVETCGGNDVLVSIQGLVSVYASYYYGGIDSSLFRHFLSLRDILKMETMSTRRNVFVKNGKYEKQLIRSVSNIAGRTSWDYANCWALNKDIRFFHLDELLRDAFYENVWSLNKCRRHSIFLSQVHYPIKGIHKFIEALPLILDVYPDTQVYLCGDDLSSRPWYRRDTYWNYVHWLIKKNGVRSHLHFLGRLNENQMVEQYLSANVFVCPSAIENSSNSVCEAQLLGTPVVASYVGGMMDLIVDERTGLLYRFEETAMLAKKVCELFANDDMAVRLSCQARETALARHDKVKVAKDLMNIYEIISNRK